MGKRLDLSQSFARLGRCLGGIVIQHLRSLFGFWLGFRLEWTSILVKVVRHWLAGQVIADQLCTILLFSVPGSPWGLMGSRLWVSAGPFPSLSTGPAHTFSNRPFFPGLLYGWTWPTSIEKEDINNVNTMTSINSFKTDVRFFWWTTKLFKCFHRF